MTSAQQSSVSRMTSLEVGPPNDPRKGFDFEDEVALHAVLKLKQHQALAREVKFAKGFDDIVIVNNFNNGTLPEEYYLFQLKHKQDATKSITWNDLMIDNKSVYLLEKHFKSYLEIMQNIHNYAISQQHIKALVIVTNVSLGTPSMSNNPQQQQQPNASTTINPTNLSLVVAQGNMKRSSQLPITQDDLTFYFQHQQSIIATAENCYNIASGKRYKFNPIGIQHVTRSLQSLKNTTIKQLNVREFEKFLELLEFEVDTPNLAELEDVNKSLLKLFFPFHWTNGDASQEQCYTKIKEKVLELFKPIQQGGKNMANWATVNERQAIFEKFIPSFKEHVSLGSIKGYEAGPLTELFNQVNFGLVNQNHPNQVSTPYACVFSQTTDEDSSGNHSDSFPPVVFNSESNKSKARELPIFLISSEKTNATITTMKIFKAAQQTKCGDGYLMQHKTLIVQVQDEKGIENINEYLKNLSRQVQPFTEIHRERFYFAIQVSPFFKPVDEAKGSVVKTLIQKLTALKQLRSWIQFVVVTQQPIHNDPNETSTDVVSIGDLPIKWRDLTEETKTYLYEKTLFLRGSREVLPSSEASSVGNETYKAEEAAESMITINEQKCWKTSLKALGLDKESIGDWLCPLSLGELITHNEERPLCLALPEYDADLDAMYIARYVKFPLVKLNRMNEELRNRIVFDEREFNEKIARDKTKTCHLLERLKPSSHNFDLWWLKSNGRAHNGHTTKTYHLLKKLEPSSDKSDLRWLKSNGKAFEELEPHVTKSKDSIWCFPELGLLERTSFGSTGLADNKLAIVVDLPGKGKTCLLTSLTNRYLKQKSEKEQLDCLMLRINLLEVKASAWESEKIGLIENEKSAVSYLLNILFTTEDLNVLDAAIIKQMCLDSSASVFVLLDGFDEINDHQRSIIYKLIDQLLLGTQGLKRIILTSRPDNGLEEELQEHFKQFPLYLRNFDEEDQIDFLVNRWSMKLHQDDTATEKLCGNDEGTVNEIRNYAKELVEYSQKALKDEDRSFLDIPLQCLIVSECFFKDLKQYLTEFQQNSNSRNYRNLPIAFQDENFQLLHLYDRFYDTKVDILFHEKAKFSPSNDAASFVRQDFKQHYFNAMIQLSVFQMMTDIKNAETLCRTSWKTYRNSKYTEDLKRGRKLGLIQGADENPLVIKSLDAPHVKLIHRTFAEYFFAKYLFNVFIQTDSELLEGNDFNISNEILVATYEIITKKIFMETEYAGILRFFDRMLANHIIPPISEEDVFSKNNRKAVMKEWPVISHEQFNSFLAKTLASECSEAFKKKNKWFWEKKEVNQFDSTKLLNRMKKKVKVVPDEYSRYPEDLTELLKFFSSDIILMKERKAPERTPLISLTSDTEKNKFNVITLLIQCIKEYTSRPEVSDNVREALSHFVTLTWLTWMENKPDDTRYTALSMQWYDPAKELSNEQNLIFSKWFFIIVYYNVIKETSYCAALGMACSRMKRHRNSLLNFQGHVKTLVKSIFDSSRNDWTIVNSFFENDYDEKITDAKVAEIRSRHFVSVLSLTSFIFPYDDSLLTLQVNWFRAKLDRFLVWWNRPKRFNPFTIIATTEYLLTSINKRVAELPPLALKNGLIEMKETIVASALKYWNDMVPLLARAVARAYYSDNVSINVLLWHVVLADQVISYLHDEQRQRQAVLNLFFTATGRWLLLAFAEANCCRQGVFVIHFPSEMYQSEKTMKRFEEWSNHTLESVWQEKNEREFIAFLFKNEMKLPDDIDWTEQDKFSLHALPCLLFSDTVNSYIPEQLSQDGLEYFEETLKNIYMPKADSKSLWDNIVQLDLPSSDSTICRHKSQEQKKMLKEKIEKRKQELLSVVSSDR